MKKNLIFNAITFKKFERKNLIIKIFNKKERKNFNKFEGENFL